MGRPLLLAAALLAALPGCAREPDVEPLGRPPIVLVLFDALHAGRISHLGYERETTPNLDRLATEGVSFQHAFAPAPYTIASIASLMTGRLPDAHGVTEPGTALAGAEVTLAERLGAAGYRTVAAVGNLNGSAKFGNDQGFEVFRELFRAERPEQIRKVHPEEGNLRLASADLFVEFTREVLADEPTGRPLFLYLHVFEPHAPYLMPSEYRELWLDPEYDGPFVDGDIQPFLDTFMDKLDVTPPDVEAAVALYDANLRWADHNFGRIRALLEEAGLWDEALVLVTSDHGEAFWEHGRWGHSDHLFEEQVRVPLMIKLPAARAARLGVRPELVSILDIVPSVCRWLDLPVGGPVDGIPLAALVEGHSSGSERELYLRTRHQPPHLGLRSDSHKTIVERRARGMDVRYFSLADDPGELRDLYEREQSAADRDARQLVDWSEAARAQQAAERGAETTAEEQRMLEKIGYVDGGG